MKVRVIGADGYMGKIHCRTYRDLGMEIVENGEDIVSIASPDQTHGKYVIDALMRDKHVFCEKPLCTRESELAQIEALCKANPRLHVGQNFPLRYVFMDAKRVWIVPYRMEAFYNWARTEKLGVGWRKNGYSLVMGGMIHLTDLACWFCNDVWHESSHIIWAEKMGWKGAACIVASCSSKYGVITLTMDGGPGPRQHEHGLTLSGDGWYYRKNNTDPTPKDRAIGDFVRNLNQPPHSDFRATRLCLEIEKCTASLLPGQ